MTAIEYMQKQVEKYKKTFEKVKTKSGVTDIELNNILEKICYYEEAVKALEYYNQK